MLWLAWQAAGSVGAGAGDSAAFRCRKANAEQPLGLTFEQCAMKSLRQAGTASVFLRFGRLLSRCKASGCRQAHTGYCDLQRDVAAWAGFVCLHCTTPWSRMAIPKAEPRGGPFLCSVSAKCKSRSVYGVHRLIEKYGCRPAVLLVEEAT